MNFMTCLGLPVSAASMEETCSGILEPNAGRTSRYVCVANAHMLVTARQRPDLAEVLHNAFYVTADGMPLVWSLRHKGWRDAQRVAGPDLTLRLCEEAEKKGLSVFFYGGSPDSLHKLQGELTRRFPRLIIAGSEAPPQLPEKPNFDAALASRIRQSGARVVFVGLGCPKQEFWMAAHAPDLSAVLVGVGAAFDFISGTIQRAPVWMQKSGLEWLYRLVREPKRLWKRYLVTNSLFLWYWATEKQA